MERQTPENEFSFKSLLVPFTTQKAIFWIIAIGLVVFFNMLFNGFVWDDEGQLLNNTLVHNLSNIPYLLQGGTFIVGVNQIASNYYKPLLPIVLTITYNFFGPNAFPFHLLQLLLHIANAIMVFLLFAKLLNKKTGFFLAIVFLIHPINVESVVYVSALQEPLFFFFGIAALLITIYKDLNIKQAIMVFLLLLLSVLSKETGFLFVGITLLYIVLFKTKKLFHFSLFSVGLLSIYSFLRFYLASGHLVNQHLAPISRASFLVRFYTMPSINLFYIRTFFFPIHLAVSQDWLVKKPTVTNYSVPLGFDITIFVICASIAIYLFQKRKEFFVLFIFFFTWFVFGLLLHLQIVPLDMTVADRWFYFPIIGLLGILGIALHAMKINFKNEWIILAVTIILLFLGIRTFGRNGDWASDQTLFLHDVKVNTNSYSLENSAGVQLYKMNNLQDARYHFLKSSELAPYYWINWFDLGALEENQKHFSLARKYYQTSIDTGDYEGGYLNLAILYVKLGEYKNAQNISIEGLQKYSNDVPLRLALATAEYELGDYAHALENAQKAYILLPNDNTKYFLDKISRRLPLDLNFK